MLDPRNGCSCWDEAKLRLDLYPEWATETDIGYANAAAFGYTYVPSPPQEENQSLKLVASGLLSLLLTFYLL